MKCKCESCGGVFNTPGYKSLCGVCRSTLKDVDKGTSNNQTDSSSGVCADKPKKKWSLFGD